MRVTLEGETVLVHPVTHEAAVGYAIVQQCQGRGYATDALRTLGESDGMLSQMAYYEIDGAVAG